ncbi:MAG: flagellar type III secretion system pore protein FliP [Rhodospirillaceae bacterium]|jgi:flagellar biosynthetic protein FliP
MRLTLFSRVLFLFLCLCPLEVAAQALSGIPFLSIEDGQNGAQEYTVSLKILLFMTALTVLPSILLGMTAFARIIIVLSILRTALGTQQTPPNQILVALALFITFFVMAPTFTKIYDEAYKPYSEKTINIEEAFGRAASSMKTFMVRNTREKDLLAFSDMNGGQKFQDEASVPWSILLPAFITSELKTAFQIGFLIYLPFLVIDMIIASTLMSLGMMMLSPMLISLPFKLLLFVLVDGWTMTVGSIIQSYG